MFHVFDCTTGERKATLQTQAAAYAECLRLAGMTEAPADGYIGFDIEQEAPAVDAYYCELVDGENNRHWSDVIYGDGDLQAVKAEALALAECEVGLFAGLALRLYPLCLAQPVAEYAL